MCRAQGWHVRFFDQVFGQNLTVLKLKVFGFWVFALGLGSD